MPDNRNVVQAGTMFPPELVRDVFDKVKGHSTLARLCAAKPMSFSGIQEFVFTMEGEASFVAESGQKPAGKAAVTPVVIRPLKVIYQARVTEEFLRTTEERQLSILTNYSEGFTKKIARALDIGAFHGVDPATKTATALIGDNCFDTIVTDTVTYDASAPDDNIDSAAQVLQTAESAITGIAMAPAFGGALGAMKATGTGLAIYPEFRFGADPGSFASIPSNINSTISFNSSPDRAIVGDFAGAFRWGYADQIRMEVIPYGDPDGLGDLKRTNEICLRSEAFFGWGILDAKSFVRIVQSA